MFETLPLSDPNDSPPPLPGDARLVVTDVDGTLLDAEGRLPEMFWDILAEFRRRSITFAVASGRQYPSLELLFDRDPAGIVFIADNGGYVVRDGVELGATPLDRHSAAQVVGAVRALAPPRDLGVIWSGRTTAHTERRDAYFLEQARVYYPTLTAVNDVLHNTEAPIKVSLLELDGVTEPTLAAVTAATPQALVTQTSPVWIDVTAPTVNKGAALAKLQATLGVSPDQTVAFGDYLNDLEMMDAATFSFAMANAHPEVLGRARAVAPSNAEHGALRTMTALLAAD